jgi:hypothetical protein
MGSTYDELDVQFSMLCFSTSISIYSTSLPTDFLLLFLHSFLISFLVYPSLPSSLNFLTSSTLFTPLSYLLFSSLFFLIHHYHSIYFTTVHIFAFLVSIKICLETNFINFSYNIEIRKKLIINDIKNILL